MVAQAYCPLVRGQRFGEEGLKKLAEKYGKTGAQILIRWSLQKVILQRLFPLDLGLKTYFRLQGFVPLPKSVTPSRIEENANVYDFELSAEDMRILDTDDYSPCAWDPTKSTLDE